MTDEKKASRKQPFSPPELVEYGRRPFSSPKIFQFGRVSSLTLKLGQTGADGDANPSQRRVQN